MPLFDRVKAGAAQAVQKAQEAGQAGQAKLNDIQAARHLDSLFRDLGSAIYDQHAGRATSNTAPTIERLYGEIEAHEAEHGKDVTDTGTTTTTSDTTSAPPSGTSSGGTPAGDFKLD
jgi:phage host-nuclease inhibitor protein Gam